MRQLGQEERKGKVVVGNILIVKVFEVQQIDGIKKEGGGVEDEQGL